MITTDQSQRTFQLLKFPPTTPKGPPVLTRSPDAQRVRDIFDRLQVLALARPRIADFLLELNERFLTRWERYIAEGTR